MLKHAQINKYAIPSFNFDNLEMLIAITNAAEKQKAPICLMITPNTINCIDLKYVLAIINNVINRAKVPFFFTTRPLSWSTFMGACRRCR
ncbi:class II fructose-bisphosphate aldolase [Spiroplasma endosymbiont of Apeira syringaria]|uniref:class II fructose-bisphosphate aldolase n=1 Tax=Spiroplasma endosymbiont of Apeira syringaria TaxID=3066307 RepID=UPI0030CD9372